MSKSKKPKKTAQRSEAPSPLHAGSEGVAAIQHHNNPAMTADGDREISDRIDRRDSGASLPNTPGTEAKSNRHSGTGRYTDEGPSMPGMGHEVLQIDLGDPSQQVAMTRITPTSAPNGPPVGPRDVPAVNILDTMSLNELTE